MGMNEAQKSKSSHLRQEFIDDTLPLIRTMRKAKVDGDDKLFTSTRDMVINSYFELDNKLAEMDNSPFQALMNKYRGKSSDGDAIWTYEYLGLLKACETYDPDNSEKANFLTYSYIVMEQEILNKLQAYSTIPISLLRRKWLIDQCEDELRRRLEREPSDEELFDLLSKKSDKVTMKSLERLRGVSISLLLNETSDGLLDRGIARNGIREVGMDEDDPKKTFSEYFDLDLVRNIVLDDENKVLTEQEKILARKMFYEDKNISEICRETGLSRSVVEAIRKAMAEKIKNELK